MFHPLKSQGMFHPLKTVQKTLLVGSLWFRKINIRFDCVAVLNRQPRIPGDQRYWLLSLPSATRRGPFLLVSCRQRLRERNFVSA
jgi:hypothetical protein